MTEKYTVSEKTVVWEHGENVHNASELRPDNLYILASDGTVLWNMRDTVGYEDVCTGLEVSGTSIRFITFNGLGFNVDTDKMTVTEKKTVK